MAQLLFSRPLQDALQGKAQAARELADAYVTSDDDARLDLLTKGFELGVKAEAHGVNVYSGEVVDRSGEWSTTFYVLAVGEKVAVKRVKDWPVDPLEEDDD